MKLLLAQFYPKSTRKLRRLEKSNRKTIIKNSEFLRNLWRCSRHMIRQSRKCLNELASYDVQEISIYGIGNSAEVLYDLTFELPLKIRTVYSDEGGGRFHEHEIVSVATCVDRNEKIIIASMVEVEKKVKHLKQLGVNNKDIVVLPVTPKGNRYLHILADAGLD